MEAAADDDRKQSSRLSGLLKSSAVYAVDLHVEVCRKLGYIGDLSLGTNIELLTIGWAPVGPDTCKQMSSISITNQALTYRIDIRRPSPP